MEGVNFYFNDVKVFRLEKTLLRNTIYSIAKDKGFRCGNINIIFCTDEFLLRMNKDYLDHDYYTDIITFDYSGKDEISGELYISVERVKENAANFDVKFGIELVRVIFHGILHLVGYKDKEESEQAVMREKEEYYLSIYGKN